MDQRSDKFVAALLEHTQLQGYRMNLGGEWTDSKGNFIAKDTQQLIEDYSGNWIDYVLARRREPETTVERVVRALSGYGSTPAYDREAVKLLNSERDPRGKKKQPNTPEKYKALKTYDRGRAGVPPCKGCGHRFKVGDLRYWRMGWDICVPCFADWKRAGGGEFSDYFTPKTSRAI